MILKALRCIYFHGLIDENDIDSFSILICLDKLQKINSIFSK